MIYIHWSVAENLRGDFTRVPSPSLRLRVSAWLIYGAAVNRAVLLVRPSCGERAKGKGRRTHNSARRYTQTLMTETMLLRNVTALHNTLRSLDSAVRASSGAVDSIAGWTSPAGKTALAGTEPQLSPQSAASWRAQSHAANEAALRAADSARSQTAALMVKLKAAEERAAEAEEGAARAEAGRAQAVREKEALASRVAALTAATAAPNGVSAHNTAPEFATLRTEMEFERARADRLDRLLQSALSELVDLREVAAAVRQVQAKAESLQPEADKIALELSRSTRYLSKFNLSIYS
jgi:chemotaxis protein histidine kinase CheA